MAWLVVDEDDNYLIFEHHPAKTTIGWIGRTCEERGIPIKESNLATRFADLNYDDDPVEI